MTYADGTLLRANDQPQVWLIQGGQRHWIPSPDIFNADGFSWSAILVVSDAEINAIPQGYDVPLYTTWITPGPNDPALPGDQQPTEVINGIEYKRWRSSGGGHTVYSRASYVTQTGAVHGETITMNAVWGLGYHSGTVALVTDTNGIVTWNSPVFRVGVNAKGFGPTVVSYNAWSYTVPADIADHVAGFAIAVSDSPDNLKQIMDNSLGVVLGQLTPLVTAIGSLFSGSKKSGTGSGTSITSSAELISQGWTEPEPSGGHRAGDAPEPVGGSSG